MSEKTKTSIYQVGAKRQDIYREVFNFDDHICYLQSTNFNIFMDNQINP